MAKLRGTKRQTKTSNKATRSKTQGESSGSRCKQREISDNLEQISDDEEEHQVQSRKWVKRVEEVDNEQDMDIEVIDLQTESEDDSDEVS